MARIKRTARRKITKPDEKANPYEIKSETKEACKSVIKTESDDTLVVNLVDENNEVEVKTADPSFEFAEPTGTKRRVKKRRRSELDNDEKISFSCEWKGCDKHFDAPTELYTHICGHVENFEIVDEKYICLWGPCVFTSPCSKEITRHLHYHGYQNALTTIGRHECKKSNVPKCTIDSPTRKLLPELPVDFVCFWANCHTTFKSITSFHKHVSNHSVFEFNIRKTPDNSKPIVSCEWENCNKPFDNNYRLVEHLRKHTSERLAGCYQCGLLFCSKTSLFDHCRRQMANNTHEYQCSKCFKFFSTEKLLRNHIIVHVNCYKCSLCDMTCSSTSSLAKHFRFRHVKDRPVKCPKCDYNCVQKSDLNRHEEQVHQKKLYQCEENGCSYSVKSLNLFRKHYNDVHDRSPAIYVCPSCDKLYKRGKDLSIHLIRKHNYQFPSGHKRFTFRIDEHGFHRLETTRIESLDVTEQIMSSPSSYDHEPIELTQDSTCFEVLSLGGGDGRETSNGMVENVYVISLTDPVKKEIGEGG